VRFNALAFVMAGDGTNFHDSKRSDDAHESTTGPDARLYRKSYGKESKLAYLGPLVENRNGLIAAAMATRRHTEQEIYPVAAIDRFSTHKVSQSNDPRQSVSTSALSPKHSSMMRRVLETCIGLISPAENRVPGLSSAG
jgi:hypothetical protein